MEELKELLAEILRTRSLRKIVFSRPKDKSILKATGRIVNIRNERFVQIEKFLPDGKALHENQREDEALDALCTLAQDYRQIDILTSVGNCAVLISKSGKSHINNAIKGKLLPLPGEDNDRAHSFILDPERAAPFLSALGVCDEHGRIFDKKRSKFKQIERFVEILDDVYNRLPQDGTLIVCDLCCGKSYLTFAVYYYLTVLKGRQIEMYGVDLKADVIEFCAKLAKQLDFSHLHFSCGDISAFTLDTHPHLVLSLHACDIATDIVLYNALRLGADVILSTPCCHHEMMKQLDCAPLSFVSEHSMYRQKLCDALTDALRCKRLEAEGYKVTALELIDPEETPKNILIKACKAAIPQEKRAKALEEYKEAVRFLGVEPYLDKLIREAER